MKEVKFSVAAKAARLIGRENIADVDGALVELIKNAYDADASCVLVKLQIPFPDIPNILDLSLAAEVLNKEDLNLVMSYYNENDNEMVRNTDLTQIQLDELRDILFSYNRIIIADNGYGMTEEVVGTTWMHIGTSDKESNIVSPKGRIKTGAKGIGRFALDKLSKHSLMYTKSVNSDSVIRWSMDWEQFAKVKLIEDVKAELQKDDNFYEEYVRSEFKDYENIIEEHDWTTGTMIILTPTREPWSKRLFRKVNTNLNSINPIGSVDKFEVVIDNEYWNEFDYHTEKVAIDKEDFDYRIRVEYDGKEGVFVRLLRNEVDLSCRTITVEKYGHSVTKNIDEFWQNEKFQVKNYTKDDYNKEIIKEIKILEALKEDERDRIQSVGPFQAEMYFLRNTNSVGYDLMKKVATRKRKKLLEHFSGIKIYRDNFKVRPYGDEGALYDWLGLGVRAQKSPAAPSHPTGRWRVEPYQMIGWVKIGRETNPELEDMANREGIALTDVYYIFVSMLQEAVNEFEYDRQYIYREYAKWILSIEKELADFAERVKEEARKRTQRQQNNKSDDEGTYEENDEQERFTEDELFSTVQQLVDEAEKELKSKQMLQVLSSSGIILNTFFHEFNAINTQFHIQAPQIRSRVNYILQGNEYTGLPVYNPYTRIDVLEKNDKLTAAFLDVVMEGLKKNSLDKREISLHREIVNILEKWQLMLEDKHITIRSNIFDKREIEDNVEMSIVDLYIILNNFLLNSAWFLEQEHNPNREVWFDLFKNENDLCFVMENNGPALADKFKDNPDKIFEMGETSKDKDGTGLGLWVVKETVERNNGTIKVLERNQGFGLEIIFKGMVK
ncbi:MAG: sensor histidine kinase [Lachnospiraceae bacterium]|nr:sensor histidine kinase [Lachnospiraceae bacterium]